MSASEPFAQGAREWIETFHIESTKKTYTRDLALWLAHCKEAGADPGSPSREVVNDFREEIKKYAPLTIRRILSCLSSAFKATRPDAINPFAPNRIRRPSGSEFTQTETVSDEDARRIIAALSATLGKTHLAELNRLRNLALLWILWSTGMRRMSVVSIRRDWISRRDGMMIVRHLIKGGEVVTSELSDEAAQAVDAWVRVAPASRWLFCVLREQKEGERSKRMEAINVATVTSIVSLAAEAVGLKIHPHQFRTSFITFALDAGIPLERVRAAVHHKSADTTLRYDRGRRGAGVTAEVATFRKKKENQ